MCEFCQQAVFAIPVVCAVIERDGLVLVARRAEGRHGGGLWEFPGGKVECGESAEEALAREIREELGAEIVVLGKLPRVVHDYGDVRVALIPFFARLCEGAEEPRALEHSALRWVSVDELPSVEFAAANVRVAEEVGRRRVAKGF